MEMDIGSFRYYKNLKPFSNRMKHVHGYNRTHTGNGIKWVNIYLSTKEKYI
jgi:hypothetical protein